MLQSYTTATSVSTPKIRRIKCPVHGGKNLSAAVGYTHGRPWAKCHSRGCASADILAALDLTPSPSSLLRLPRPTPTPTSSTTPLLPVSPAQASQYLSGIRTPHGATIAYQRNDGQRGKHWRNTDKRRNPGVGGDGWQARRFNPQDPATAVAITLTEGEKDSAVLAQAGMVSFCAPRGAASLPGADYAELVETAKETGLPVILAGDRDGVGVGAMRRVREQLRKQGLNPIDTASHAPLKGSIADLPTEDMLALVGMLAKPQDSNWKKPWRDTRQNKQFKCLRPIRLRGEGADGQRGKKYRPCGNTSACAPCELWELHLHVERAWRGRPVQMISVSGFGDDASTIAQTVGAAKAYRERWIDRLRRNVGIYPIQETLYGESRHFLTALRVRDDFRAGLALFLTQPLTAKELTRERARAERAGLTFTVTDNPSRPAIEAVAPKSLSIRMEGVGDTDKTNTWTSSGWKTWSEMRSTYAVSEWRELEEGEDFDPDAIWEEDWLKEHGQQWDSGRTLLENLIQREEHAHYNAQLWVSACTGLNLEILTGIGLADKAGDIAAVHALIAEVGDYNGPDALLRDVAKYLN